MMGAPKQTDEEKQMQQDMEKQLAEDKRRRDEARKRANEMALSAQQVALGSTPTGNINNSGTLG